MTFSTRSVGVVLMPLALLLPLGFYQVIVRRPAIANLLVLIGFVTAPAAAVLVPEPAAIIRAVALLPFAALLAGVRLRTGCGRRRACVRQRRRSPPGGVGFAIGLAYLVAILVTKGRVGVSTLMLIGTGLVLLAAAFVARPWPFGRVVAIAVIALIPIQFARFSADYFGDYRVRANSWLGGNLRGALEQIITRSERDRATRIYFATLQSTRQA